jgi:hypothetical protein
LYFCRPVVFSNLLLHLVDPATHDYGRATNDGHRARLSADANMASRRRLGGKEGSAMYYLIGEYLFPSYKGRTIVTDSNICWELMKQGYMDLESLRGVSAAHMNDMAKISGVAGEKPMCRWLFIRLGDRWSPDTWNDKADFDSFRSWAFS